MLRYAVPPRPRNGPTRRPARRLVVTALVTGVGLGSFAGCTGGKEKPTPASTTTLVVTGRATAPTDINAHGIVISKPGDAFRSSLPGGRELVITYDDWNTIVASTKIPKQVRVRIDPAFNPTATTGNRVQYLADLVGLDVHQRIDAIGLLATVKNGRLIGIPLIRNSDAHDHRLTLLQVKLMRQSSRQLLQEGTFYDASTEHLNLPARSSYLALLDFGRSKVARDELTNIVWSFHYEFK